MAKTENPGESKKDRNIWITIQVFIWIIFVAYCVEAGTLLCSYAVIMYNHELVGRLYLNLSLSDMLQYSPVLYSSVVLMVVGISTAQAYMFYLILKLCDIFNLSSPFHQQSLALCRVINKYAFGIGVAALIARIIFDKLSVHGFDTTQLEPFYESGMSYLPVSAILFVFIKVYERGMELKNESDLTI